MPNSIFVIRESPTFHCSYMTLPKSMGFSALREASCRTNPSTTIAEVWL